MQRDRNMQIGGCPEISLKLVSRQWDYGYSELLRLVDVPMLSERRLRLKLAQVFKIVHSLCYFPDNLFQLQLLHSSRLARSGAYLNILCIQSLNTNIHGCIYTTASSISLLYPPYSFIIIFPSFYSPSSPWVCTRLALIAVQEFKKKKHPCTA